MSPQPIGSSTRPSFTTSSLSAKLRTLAIGGLRSMPSDVLTCQWKRQRTARKRKAMAKKEDVKIDGLKECKTALRKLPDATAKNVLRRVMKKRAVPLVETAKRLVPVDEGDLRDS